MKKFVTVFSLAVLAIALTIGIAIAAEGPGPGRGDKSGPPMMGQFNPVERVIRAVESMVEKPLTNEQKEAIREKAKIRTDEMKAVQDKFVKSVADIAKIPVEKLSEKLTPPQGPPRSSEKGTEGQRDQREWQWQPRHPVSTPPAPESGRA